MTESDKTMETSKKTEEEYLQEFGLYIKDLRTKRDMTLAQVAEKLNVSTNYVSQIERGIRRVTDEMIQELALIYNHDEDIFFRKAGRIPIRVLEEIQTNPMLQKALSFVRKKKISEEKRRQMEEEILRVYSELLNVHKDEILKEEYSIEIGIYELSFLNMKTKFGLEEYLHDV
jgi:transcriptional regulator with XRE-family HTH domain